MSRQCLNHRTPDGRMPRKGDATGGAGHEKARSKRARRQRRARLRYPYVLPRRSYQLARSACSNEVASACHDAMGGVNHGRGSARICRPRSTEMPCMLHQTCKRLCPLVPSTCPAESRGQVAANNRNCRLRRAIRCRIGRRRKRSAWWISFSNMAWLASVALSPRWGRLFIGSLLYSN